MCSCHYTFMLMLCSDAIKTCIWSFYCVHLINIIITMGNDWALCLVNSFWIPDSTSLKLPKTNESRSPVELEYEKWWNISFLFPVGKTKTNSIVSRAPSFPQLPNAGFLQSCTSSLKTVLLLHEWWWLNLDSDPYNLHISESPLLSQRETNGCLVWLQAEQPSVRTLASF